jgi:hypothetical protein
VKPITCNIPDTLYEALQERMETDKASCDHVVSMALSQYLGKPIHTLFQVSTSAALVEGRLAAPGDSDAAAGPRVEVDAGTGRGCRNPCRAPPRDGGPSTTGGTGTRPT